MPFCIEMPEIMIAWSCVWSTFSSWGCFNCTHNSTSFKPCALEINFKEKHILYICWNTLEVQLDLIHHFVHHHHHPHRHRHHHRHHRCHHHTHLKWQQCYQEIETVMVRQMRSCRLLCKKMPAMPMQWPRGLNDETDIHEELDGVWMMIGWLLENATHRRIGETGFCSCHIWDCGGLQNHHSPHHHRLLISSSS